MAGILRQRTPGVKLRGTVTVDLDETVAMSREAVLQLIVSRGGKFAANPRNNGSYDLIEVVKKDGTKIGYKEVPALFRDAWELESKIQLADSRLPQIIDNIAQEWRVELLTGTSGRRKRVKEYLERHKIRFDALHFVAHANAKVDAVMSRPEIAAHVDDEPFVAVDIAMNNRTVLLLERPYTGKPMARKNLMLVKSWHEVESYLRTA
jgi:hypothetical protein